MFRGLILLFLFFVFILKLAYWNGVIPPSIAQPVTFQWGTIIWGVLFLSFYLYFLRKVIRLKPGFKTEGRETEMRSWIEKNQK